VSGAARPWTRRRRTWLVAGLLAALSLVSVGVVLVLPPRPGPSSPHPLLVTMQHDPIVIAHRGGALLWPENTLLAFENAVRLGVDMLEMDLRSTADGVPVVLHDPTVDRTTEGTGRLRDLPLAELRRFDAGYRWSDDGGRSFPYRGRGVTVPTLEEVLRAFPGTPMTLELKEADPELLEKVCSSLRTFGANHRALVASFDVDALRAFRRLCPEVATSATASEARRFVLLSKATTTPPYVPPAQALQLPERYGPLRVLTPGLIAAARANDLPVHAWTINEEADMRRLLDLGVDGIVTDRPDLLLELLGRGSRDEP
jgi:glycerophosphoryl diester phosphodiesterase